jgi:hypothetical protein
MGWLSAIADSRARTLVQARGYFERAVTVILANVCRCSATGDRKGRGHRGKSRKTAEPLPFERPSLLPLPNQMRQRITTRLLVTITH